MVSEHAPGGFATFSDRLFRLHEQTRHASDLTGDVWIELRGRSLHRHRAEAHRCPGRARGQDGSSRAYPPDLCARKFTRIGRVAQTQRAPRSFPGTPDGCPMADCDRGFCDVPLHPSPPSPMPLPPRWRRILMSLLASCLLLGRRPARGAGRASPAHAARWPQGAAGRQRRELPALHLPQQRWRPRGPADRSLAPVVAQDRCGSRIHPAQLVAGATGNSIGGCRRHRPDLPHAVARSAVRILSAVR